MVETTRPCQKCGVVQSIDEFYRTGRFDSRYWTCKSCMCAAKRRPVASTGHPCAWCGEPTPPHKTKPGWFKKFCSRTCAVASGNAARLNRDRFKQYGITREEYEAMLLAQGSRCAICGSDTPRSKLNNWHIDHCHETGTVRGILCANCNMGLGQFRDDVEILTAAVRYLAGE